MKIDMYILQYVSIYVAIYHKILQYIFMNTSISQNLFQYILIYYTIGQYLYTIFQYVASQEKCKILQYSYCLFNIRISFAIFVSIYLNTCEYIPYNLAQYNTLFAIYHNRSQYIARFYKIFEHLSIQHIILQYITLVNNIL